MAIFHSHVQIITRGKEKSAVAAAAYRAGEVIESDYDGTTHDYTRKRGIAHAETILPDHAPAGYSSRAVLWNAVEGIEKASNSQLAREIEIALPAELDIGQNIALARRYVREQFVSVGMCADLCVHDKGDGNPHAHIMLTMRPLNSDGTWGAKQKKEYALDGSGGKIYDPKKRQYKCRSIPSTDWNDRAKADEWRKAWEELANAELKRHGSDSRIDRRSYAEQGVWKIPTVHLGPAASQMERRGKRTELGDINRQVAVSNSQIRQLRARINKLSDWLKSEAANAGTTTLADVISDILNRQGQSGVARLKAAAKTLLFLQQNGITDIAGLERKVGSMHGGVYSIGEKLKPLERRLKTLDEHIAQSENYKRHRKVKAQYDGLLADCKAAEKEAGVFAKGKAQKLRNAANSFYETHRAELTLHDAAERYLRDVLQSRFDPSKMLPMTKWREEREAKTAERDALYAQYDALKAETQKVEQIKRGIDEILRGETAERTAATERERTAKKTQDPDL